MKRTHLVSRLTLLTGPLAVTMLSVTGCSSVTSLQGSNLDLNPILADRVALAQPSFGVGDELGLMMFSQVALAPEASPTYEVLVIAETPKTTSAPSFDWLQGYLALAR